jgi:hypothetical protein
MDNGEELERELEEEMRLARVPDSVKSHWKGCKTCIRRFAECNDGTLYRPQTAKLARSPCSSWKSCGLESLEES